MRETLIRINYEIFEKYLVYKCNGRNSHATFKRLTPIYSVFPTENASSGPAAPGLTHWCGMVRGRI